ncbi:hypothetical protein ITP53_08660 [Nonomuraea sp. K274]|uniref:Uncharacterized protein n=1 Tax=Nonomuraea cypriaca TaxID=1187855 RepID=A0A931EZ37_9ACTN|nr:hypothetical protein [Nonomuraea cypriaca]MBF8185811.1 hypothetical protein [Nonomuraea cypriaca]
MRTMVFIHGRGQEGKNPRELLGEWRTALAAGLGTTDLAVETVLPYYGNVLHRVTAEVAGRPQPLEPADDPEEMPLHPYLPEDTAEIERRLIADMALTTGAQAQADLGDVLTWAVARRMLAWLSRHTRVDREIIKIFLQDVAVYLSHGREPVLAEVRRSVPASGEIVLVSHSLGTVVARDLLVDDGLRRRVVLWVTAGSPLGLPTIQRNLLARGTIHPGVAWLTAYDVNDIVALGHPLERAWGVPLDQVEVENLDAPHAIDRYLSHRTVAAPIGAACH